MRHRLSRLADRDVEDVLRRTRNLFGTGQLKTYAALIERTIDLAVADPTGPRSRPRPELGVDVRSLHLAAAAKRTRAASHELIYVVLPGSDDVSELVVLRVLHDAMNPRRRVAAALRDELTRSSRPRPPR